MSSPAPTQHSGWLSSLEPGTPVSSSPSPPVPVPYLHPLPSYGVIVCSTHGKAYGLLNYEEHLKRTHNCNGQLKKEVQRWLAGCQIASSVTTPKHHQRKIDHLLVKQGWQCNNVECTFLCESQESMERHCSSRHNFNSKRKRASGLIMSPVWLQRWSVPGSRFFIVCGSDPTGSYCSSTFSDAFHDPVSFNSDALIGPHHVSSAHIRSRLDRFQEAQKADRARFQSTGEPEHVSELSPWQRLTGFYKHTANLMVEDIATSYQVPTTSGDGLEYFLMRESVDRVMGAASREIARMHHIDARWLNTFIPNSFSQDPFRTLQEGSSLEYYALLWAKLVCYFHRVGLTGHFDQPMFTVTPQQKQASDTLRLAICQLCDHFDDFKYHPGVVPPARKQFPSLVERESATARQKRQRQHHGTTEPLDQWEVLPSIDRQNLAQREDERQAIEATVDQAMLALSVAFIEHTTLNGDFESVLLSFTAIVTYGSATASDSDSLVMAQMKPHQVSSVLSQLIYCAQLVVLYDVQMAVQRVPTLIFGEEMKHRSQRWLQNDQRCPISDLNRFRLYAVKIATNTVNTAMIRWDRDGNTLYHRDIEYRVSDVAREIDTYYREARAIFDRDLCLGFTDIPQYVISKLQDNWDACESGSSFLNDPRNMDVVEPGATWLRDRINGDPQASRLVYQADPTHPDRELVSSQFATLYEHSVQTFLKYLLMLIHKGSGQPGRGREVIGIRWRNRNNALRNLFLHDGYVLFVLDYHKALNLTHASRHPVRFLLPPVGQLLVQYLILIQPMRIFLQQEVSIPFTVGEYLWMKDGSVWTEDHMAQACQELSKWSMGTRIGLRAWRQIVIGIAIKKFDTLQYQSDMDIYGAELERAAHEKDDGPEGPMDASGVNLSGPSMPERTTGALAEVFHFQGSHTPFYGNQNYGGTVNFRDGLTDAGLQEYLHASRAWHAICTSQTLVQEQMRWNVSPHPPAGSRFVVSPATQLRNPGLQSCYTITHAPTQPFSAPLPLRERSLRTSLTLQHPPTKHPPRWNADSIVPALRTALRNDHATFKSVEQEQLIREITTGTPDILAILATGQGKSLAFFLPACLPAARVTVVVLPLVALKRDLVVRCQQVNLQYKVWNAGTPTLAYTNCPLVFVSVEQAVSVQFRSFLNALQAGHQLDRIVVDEVHLVLTADSYRQKLRQLVKLRAHGVQFICLTATLPPMMQPALQHQLLMNQAVVIRGITIRTDIRYRVLRQDARSRRSHFEWVVEWIRRVMCRYTSPSDESAPPPSDRVIVYVLARAEADRLAEALDALVYYSDSGDPREKNEVMQRWRQGPKLIMVATGAFGMGVDYPHVRWVFHVNAPRELIGFAQEVGRLGRDGQGGTSHVLLPAGWQSLRPAVEQQLHPYQPEEVAMEVYLNRPRCTLAVASRFLDGHPRMQYCANDALKCSECQEKGLFVPGGDEEDKTDYRDGIDTAVVSSSVDLDESDLDSGPHLATNASMPVVSLYDASHELETRDPLILSGPDQLRLLNSQQAMEEHQYRTGLRDLVKQCMICRLWAWVPTKDSPSYTDHTLQTCRSVCKWQFINAKRDALQRGQRRPAGGWIAKYTACFHCGNPQTICPPAADGYAPGQSTCPFPDLVIPIAWAVRRQLETTEALPALARAVGATLEVCQDETLWMDWIGQEYHTTLFGTRTINAVVVTNWSMNQMNRLAQQGVGSLVNLSRSHPSNSGLPLPSLGLPS